MIESKTLPAYTQGLGIGLALGAVAVAINGESVVSLVAIVAIVAITAAYVMEKRWVSEKGDK